MNAVTGIGFSLLVFLAASYAFAPRPLPQFPETTVRPETLLLLDAVRAGKRIVAAGEHGYVFISDDDGKTWKQAVTSAQATLTSLFFQDAMHGWAVGHDATILRTVDGGNTWQQVYSAPAEEKPLLHVWFDNALKGYAVGAYGSAYESIDGGGIWRAAQFLDGDMHINALTQGRNGILYLAGEAGTLARSRDGGATWEQLASPYKGSFFGLLALKDGSILAFGIRGNIFRSTDAGDTWEAVRTGSEASLMGGIVLPDGAVILVGQYGSILLSRDNGKTFTLQKMPDGKTIAAAIPSSSGGLLLFGEPGVLRTTALTP